MADTENVANVPATFVRLAGGITIAGAPLTVNPAGALATVRALLLSTTEYEPPLVTEVTVRRGVCVPEMTPPSVRVTPFLNHW